MSLAAYGVSVPLGVFFKPCIEPAIRAGLEWDHTNTCVQGNLAGLLNLRARTGC